MSRRALAEQIEVSEKYMRDRMNDVTAFSLEDVDRICDALGLNPAEFIQDVAVAMSKP